MYSSDYTNPVFPLVLVLLVLLLNSCSERSEYGEAGDYEKLGAHVLLLLLQTSLHPPSLM